MKAKNYMDCFYSECQQTDTIKSIKKHALENDTEFYIVTDRIGLYVGVLKIIDILKHDIVSGMIKDVMKYIPPILETTDLRKVKNSNFDMMPIVNNNNYPVGMITLSNVLSALSNINEIEDTGKKFFKKSLIAKYSIDHIIGKSQIILQLKELIIKAAKIKSTVLIIGETGVGKELVAQSIASLSERRYKPFVRINCAAIPENLLEAELFGYEEGAYTGAAKGGAIGKFEIADGGTIFLDEIGDMKMMMQAKILRVLQEKEVERIGGRYPIPVDVRIIAATHANLTKMVEEGTFRKDLFYRLNVIPINIAPLREHLEDIQLLVEYFSSRYIEEIGVDNYSIEVACYEVLKKYHWPGNIRELKNIVEMLIGMTNGELTVREVSRIIYEKDGLSCEEGILKANSGEAEKDTIIKYLQMNEGNKNKVAELLGISRSSLYNKLKKYNIN
jgi:transcriptional regulator with PAS, ATPase and Fis domain